MHARNKNPNILQIEPQLVSFHAKKQLQIRAFQWYYELIKTIGEFFLGPKPDGALRAISEKE
jgi:hypothetical protein